MGRSRLVVRFDGPVDGRLRSEVARFARWLRRWYTFETPLTIRLVHASSIADYGGRQVWLRWWHSYEPGEPITGEIAVESFARNLEDYGPTVAYPTVLAAMARIAKHYFQTLNCSPARVDYAERWASKVLDAYFDGASPPPPWRGARLSDVD